MVQVAVIEQLVDDGLATPAAMDEQVFQVGQAAAVDFQLAVTPAGGLADVAAAKAIIALFHALLRAGRRDHGLDVL